MLTPRTITRRLRAVRGLFAAMAAAWMLLLAPSVSAVAAEEDLLVVDGAAEIRTIQPTPIVHQVYYTLDLAYPGRGVGEAQWRELEAMGWTRCRNVDPEMESANKDWVNFLDATVVPTRTIHQHLTHWSKDDRMIMISLRYYSATYGVTPDNTTQRIVLNIQESRGREAAEWLKLDCS